MAASFAVALAIVAIVGLSVDHERLGTALRATARWSFLLFWPASVAGALVVLFGARFQALARHGRDLGLAFASAHLVHLSLAACLYYGAVKPPLPHATLVFFGIAAVWTYMLAIFSITQASARMNPRTWRVVRIVGVEYIAFAFLFDFVGHLQQGGVVNFFIYLPFTALAVAGPLLRLAATMKRLSQSRTLAA